MAPAIQNVPARTKSISFSRLAGALALIALGASYTIAQAPKKAKQDSVGKAASAEKKKPEKKLLASGLEALKLPADAIVVIYEKFAGAINTDPNQIILSFAAYKKLTDRIAELERKLGPPKPASPSTCQLKVIGSLDGETAHLHAEFKFKAEADKTLVALGCLGANPQKPELDGQEAFLQSGDDGLTVRVAAGQHVLTLDLDAAIKSADTGAQEGGAKRVLKIDLPRAAVTTLEVEQMPAGVKEARCNGLVLRKAGETLALGAAKDLTVSWLKSLTAPVDGPWLTVDGLITVRVEEKQVVTEVLLTLQDLRRRETRWILRTPPQTTAELVALEKGEARIPDYTITSDKNKQEHVVTLKEPSAEAFGVLFRTRQSRVAGTILIGPYEAFQPAGQLRQEQGIIRIKTPPAGIKLIYRGSAESAFRVESIDITDKDRAESVEARYKYWSLPRNPQPNSSKPAIPPYLVALEARDVKGTVQTRTNHKLELRETGHGWEIQATTTIHAKPIRAGVEVLEVQLPRAWPPALSLMVAWPRSGLPVSLALAAWGGDGRKMGILWPYTAQYKLEPSATIGDHGDSIDDLSVDGSGKLRLVLSEKKYAEFTIILKGAYPLPAGDQHAILELPVPLNTSDQGGEVRIDGPSTQQLLLGEAGQETPAAGKSKHTFSSETAPETVEFGWRPYREELPVAVVIDFTLRDGKVEARQRISFPAAKPAPRLSLDLLSSPALEPAIAAKAAESLSYKLPSGSFASVGGTEAGSGPWPVPFIPGNDRTLELRYEFPVRRTGPVQMPLFWLRQATRIDTSVRVFSLPESSSRTLAELEGPRWGKGKLEKVVGHDFFPILMLTGRERDMPLRLKLSQAPVPSLATAVVERCLIRVTTLPRGGQLYRARFRIARLSTPALDIELPPGASHFAVQIDGISRIPRELGPRPTDRANGAIRLKVEIDAESSPGPALLEVRYVIGPDGETEGPDRADFRGSLQTLLPPTLDGVLFLGKVRWQVDPVPGQIILNLGGEATSEQRWGLRGWLLASRPALTSAELETWLGEAANPADIEPALLCWQTAPEPLHLVRVARKSWLLLCSLLLLTLGLSLSFAPLLRGPSRVLCGILVVIIFLAALATAALWPGTLPDILYGCEPGLAVLIPIVAVQWLVQQRYRRQLVFMPGFTRLKAGSSLVRGGSSNRPVEPSTVDKQPAQESLAPRPGP